MPVSPATSAEPLHASVDEKLGRLLDDLHAEGWNSEDALDAIAKIARAKLEERREAGAPQMPTMEEEYVSDGNEG